MHLKYIYSNPRLICDATRVLFFLSLFTLILLWSKFTRTSSNIHFGREGSKAYTVARPTQDESPTQVKTNWLRKTKSHTIDHSMVKMDSILVKTLDQYFRSANLNRKMNLETMKYQFESETRALKPSHTNNFDSVMNYNSHFTPQFTKDIYKPGYFITNGIVCDDIHENVLVTILVISAPDHFKQREAIRNSWGNTRDNKEVVFSFLVGLSDNSTVGKAVTEESEKNGDLIVNNIDDLYQNLSLKTISGFVWLKQFCPKSQFLLKVDDDMFVHLEKLLERLRSYLHTNEEPRVILGKISKK